MNIGNIEKEILQNIEKMDNDDLPNIYIFGDSVCAMESLGIAIADTIEKQKKMRFKGIAKHFSVIMPYFDGYKDAVHFLRDLKESISIAQDCYDEFCGIVLIECEEDWSKYGANTSMQKVFTYMRSLRQVCFVVLMPEGKVNGKNDELFSAFSSVGIWMKINYSLSDVQYCVSKCIDIAQKEGYVITDEVRQALYHRLNQRRQTVIDNESAVKQWMKQIIFNRQMSNNQNRTISIEEVNTIPEILTKEHNISIGFGTNR